jgi:predicted RNase H-like HicB family nuclease
MLRPYRTRADVSVMNTFTAVVEKDFDTNLYVGYVPGFPGVHSQGETLDELQKNLCEVIEMLLEDEQTRFETVFVAIQ